MASVAAPNYNQVMRQLGHRKCFIVGFFILYILSKIIYLKLYITFHQKNPQIYLQTYLVFYNQIDKLAGGEEGTETTENQEVIHGRKFRGCELCQKRAKKRTKTTKDKKNLEGFTTEDFRNQPKKKLVKFDSYDAQNYLCSGISNFCNCRANK